MRTFVRAWLSVLFCFGLFFWVLSTNLPTRMPTTKRNESWPANAISDRDFERFLACGALQTNELTRENRTNKQTKTNALARSQLGDGCASGAVWQQRQTGRCRESAPSGRERARRLCRRRFSTLRLFVQFLDHSSLGFTGNQTVQLLNLFFLTTNRDRVIQIVAPYVLGLTVRNGEAATKTTLL